MPTDYDKLTWEALQEGASTQHSAPAAPIAEAIVRELQESNSHLTEQLNDIRMMFALEDQGWTNLLGSIGSDDTPGLSLEQLKDVSKKVNEYIVGNPIIKRGTELRASYVWSKGVNIPGAEEVPGKRGAKSAIYTFVNNPKTKATLTGPEIHGEMERSAVSSGTYLLLGEDSSKKLSHPIPLEDVSGIYCNPNYVGEIWAYQRTWQTVSFAGQKETRKRWYFTDRYEGTRPASIGEGAASVAVEQGFTIIDQRFNTHVGWPLGIPDGLVAITWARIYTELMMHGKVMTEALAKFALKVTSQTAKGSANVGVKLASNTAGPGATASLGTGNDLVPLSSAGKAYDFGGIRAVAAMVATSLEVSIIHLLSDPGAAGSSYGSASNLDLPTKRAMVSRQNLWAEFIERVIKWGTGKDVSVTFSPLDDPDIYRESQVVALAWASGAIHPDEIRPRILEVAGIASLHDEAPDGILLPNNKESWERSDIDPKDGPSTSTGSPDQGVSNGTGGTDSALKNDQRESMNSLVSTIQSHTFLDELRSLVERLEQVKGS